MVRATEPPSQITGSDDGLKTSRATPQDAFRRARELWIVGERIHLASLAEELNIGRATLFRWVGNKDLLLGEILWSTYEPIRTKALAQTQGHGVDYIVGVYRRINRKLLNSRPLRTFISQDPEYALRILTSTSSTIHSRVVKANARTLREQIAEGHLRPPMKTDSLSYFMVRLAESCLYSDVICDREPREEELEDACKAVRILLGGKLG
ncbi:QsdR family transcriptional regulator [Marinobacter caseinilyticus]|uniref:QsdR family transcriptional regulator n=1 Tax=Marinobacter caseinilyticus TaxID=2692195 RepID=UPI001EEB2DF9|nr:QsdR family transcriptional regulator [Marinobacter caseinilyticus]